MARLRRSAVMAWHALHFLNSFMPFSTASSAKAGAARASVVAKKRAYFMQFPFGRRELGRAVKTAPREYIVTRGIHEFETEIQRRNAAILATGRSRMPSHLARCDQVQKLRTDLGPKEQIG